MVRVDLNREQTNGETKITLLLLLLIFRCNIVHQYGFAFFASCFCV